VKCLATGEVGVFAIALKLPAGSSIRLAQDSQRVVKSDPGSPWSLPAQAKMASERTSLARSLADGTILDSR
jgi:hypothetical protein